MDSQYFKEELTKTLMMGKMWGQEIIDTAHKIKKSSEYTAMYIPVKDEQP